MKVQAFPEERVADVVPSARCAPMWPVELLAHLAASIYRTRKPFGHDHWIEAAGSAGFGPESVRHLACAFDPAFGPIDTPNGRFQFLQIYTLDDAELEQCKQADRAQVTAQVLAARQAQDPDLRILRQHPSGRAAGGELPT